MVYEEIYDSPEGSLEGDVGRKPKLTSLPNLSPHLDETSPQPTSKLGESVR